MTKTQNQMSCLTSDINQAIIGLFLSWIMILLLSSKLKLHKILLQELTIIYTGKKYLLRKKLAKQHQGLIQVWKSQYQHSNLKRDQVLPWQWVDLNVIEDQTKIICRNQSHHLTRENLLKFLNVIVNLLRKRVHQISLTFTLSLRERI